MTGWLSRGHSVIRLAFFARWEKYIMAYELYASVDELLAPETLTVLTGQPVKYVRCLPMEGGFSGSSLLNVEANSDKSAECFVLKRMSPKWDWVMAATNDQQCRSVTLWQTGLLDRLQPTIHHATLACAHDGEGWALLMRNVSANMPVNPALTAAEVQCLLDTLATLHATFWQAPQLADPDVGLCDTTGLLGAFSPPTAHQLPSTTSPLPQMIIEGWGILQGMMAPDVADVLGNLFADPQPLCTTLARYPSTLVHGDYRTPHFAIDWQPGRQVVLLDWQLAGYTAATIDLAWFLSMPDTLRSPVSTDAAIEYYRQRLAERLGARFDESWWQPLLALGKLVNVLRSVCFKAWFIVHPADELHQALERRALATYTEEVRAALQWL